VNLLEFRPPAPLSATIADSALSSNTLGGCVMAAMSMLSEALALAPVTLGPHRRDANLVSEAGSGAGRDEVAPGSPVGGKYAVAVKLI
jgi:hypothetical protein